jgi:hypothetical protein
MPDYRAAFRVDAADHALSTAEKQGSERFFAAIRAFLSRN